LVTKSDPDASESVTQPWAVVATVAVILVVLTQAQVVEARANGGTTPGFYMDGHSGTLRLESVRYYAVS
jgi:hypothetical protein